MEILVKKLEEIHKTQIQLLQALTEAEKQEKEIKKEIAKKKRKITNKKYYDENFTRKDYTQTQAFLLFGKRKKELTADELKELNRVQVRQSRERRKKGD